MLVITDLRLCLALDDVTIFSAACEKHTEVPQEASTGSVFHLTVLRLRFAGLEILSSDTREFGRNSCVYDVLTAHLGRLGQNSV